MQETKRESHAGRYHCYLFSNVRTKMLAKHMCNTSPGKKQILCQGSQGAYGRKMWGASLSPIFTVSTILHGIFHSMTLQ